MHDDEPELYPETHLHPVAPPVGKGGDRNRDTLREQMSWDF